MELGAVESNHISRGLINLAQGPDKRVIRLTGCTINGHRFHTKVRERRRKSQNSGVLVQGDHQGEIIDFYGVLIDIIELYYIGRNRVLIFKCDWWDVGNKRRINVDEFGFVSVNVNKTWYKDQPFVLASQPQQVFYVNDLKLGKDWRVVERLQSRNIYDAHFLTESLQSGGDPYQQQACCTPSNSLETENDELGLLHRREEENLLVDVEVDEFMDIEGEEGHNNSPHSPYLSEDDNDTDAVV